MENTPDGLIQLIDRFKEHLEQYRSTSYDEANTRTDFIDPLFELLGWDVANRNGYSEQYREVIREDKISIEGGTKAPDYCFRIGGQMLTLHRQLAASSTDREKSGLQVQITALDCAIDSLVFRLYGLADEECSIVNSTEQ